MTEQTKQDAAFAATTSRLLRRESLRRAAQEISTATGPGLEDALARISAEVTAEAVALRTHGTVPAPVATRRPQAGSAYQVPRIVTEPLP